MSTLPRPDEVTLLISEDVRPDLGNKISLLGFFMGGDIGFQKGTPLPVILSSVTFIFWVKGGEGTFSQTVKLLKPDDSVFFESTPNQFEKKPNQAAALILKLAPFNIPVIGDYKVIMTLDGTGYEHIVPIHYL
jgi:hypothetical protein